MSRVIRLEVCLAVTIAACKLAGGLAFVARRGVLVRRPGKYITYCPQVSKFHCQVHWSLSVPHVFAL